MPSLAPHGGCNWSGCAECFPNVGGPDQPQSDVGRSQEGWTLYAWDARRMQWMRQDEFMNVSLEVALTTMLKWKADGQSAVRMDSVSNLL